MSEQIERGEIANEERAKQLHNFKKLRFEKCTPTDIDGFIEQNNEKFLWFEVKYGKAQMKTGQRLALERICNIAADCGKKAAVLLVSHNIENTNQQIMVDECLVTNIYSGGKWIPQTVPVTVKKVFERFFNG